MQWESRIRGRRDGGERTGLAGDNTDINRQQKQRDRGRESAVKKGTGVQKHRARETAEAGSETKGRGALVSKSRRAGEGLDPDAQLWAEAGRGRGKEAPVREELGSEI